MAIIFYESENELYHHGIKGQKWGVRRFQNRDGSYTQAGRRRRQSEEDYTNKKEARRVKGKRIARTAARVGGGAAAVGASALGMASLLRSQNKYQNKDGTLTDLGKARWEREKLDNLGKKKDSRIDTSQPNPYRWDMEDTRKKMDLLDSTSKLTRNSMGLIDNVNSATNYARNRNNKNPHVDLSNMTDKQLRDAINRSRLEKQYVDEILTQPASISKGKEYTQAMMRVGGGALAVGASALEIALLLKQLRGPKIPIVP